MKRIPLESWIAERILGGAPLPLTVDAIRRYQTARLRKTIGYAMERSPFYRRRLEGLDAESLTGPEDLADLPFTTAHDLVTYGPEFLCVSQSEIERVVTPRIPGENGRPRRTWLTQEDLGLTIDFFHRGMISFVEPGQKVLILMPGRRPGSVGDLLAHASRLMAVEGIVHGAVEDPSKTISEIVQRRIDCLIGIPDQVASIARHPSAQYIPSGQIKSVLLSADCRVSCHIPKAIIDELVRIWDCPVFGHYGTTEMGFGGGVECGARCGHHLREADLYVEIVDPVSGRLQQPGSYGEIVFTTLTRRGMPLIRYRTGDVSRFLPEPCPCGTVLRRLEKVRGKAHDRV